MNYILIALIVYIILYILTFLYVSKMNNSYINSWTTGIANEIVIRIIPFLVALNTYSSYQMAIWRLVAVLYVSLLFQLIGYQIGNKKQFKFIKKLMIGQRYAKRRYRIYFVLSIIVGLTAFLILANRGGGLYNWIFHNRTAYISARAGNGVWYILFELMITTMVVLIFCISEKNRKNAVLFLIPLIASYFTGSKSYVIGVVVSGVLYYDMCVKKIKTMRLTMIGAVLMGALLFLMAVQSETTLFSYSDYYRNFVLFLNRQNEVGWNYTHGLVSGENFFWNLIPRALYPNKPYIYGVIRIVALFFPESAIIAGNTPSFGEYIMPYADFGLIGVAASSFLKNLFTGMFEKNIRNSLLESGCSFNILFIYIILYFLTPVNFSILYIIIVFGFFVLIQKIKFKWKY